MKRSNKASMEKDGSFEEGKDNTNDPYCGSVDKDGSLEVGIDTNVPYCNVSVPERPASPPIINVSWQPRRSLLKQFDPFCPPSPEVVPKMDDETEEAHASMEKDGSFEEWIDNNGIYCVMADFNETLEQQQQKNSELQLQLDALEPARETMEMELIHKEDKTQRRTFISQIV
ncbi:hypothetical protein JTB14_018260 [Gonioctena quinquepunctata]|nr:hypothetical protein JTB14_018260 [Gonioctena quinquepunctata]